MEADFVEIELLDLAEFETMHLKSTNHQGD